MTNTKYPRQGVAIWRWIIGATGLAGGICGIIALLISAVGPAGEGMSRTPQVEIETESGQVMASLGLFEGVAPELVLFGGDGYPRIHISVVNDVTAAIELLDRGSYAPRSGSPGSIILRQSEDGVRVSLLDGYRLERLVLGVSLLGEPSIVMKDEDGTIVWSAP